MKNSFYGLLILLYLVVVIVGTVQAEINVNLNIGPPPIVVSAPPEVVMMPESGVYFVPDVNYDVFFYNGYWWSPRGDRWYRASRYNGPWGVIQRSYVPVHLVKVPKNYRVVYQKERHINYGQWQKQGGQNKGRGIRR